MLLRAIFLIAFLSLIGEAIVHATASLAAAALRARALDAARAAFVAGVASAQSSTARAIEHGFDPTLAALPTPVATCAASGANGCVLFVTATIASPTPQPSVTPSVCPQTDCAIVLQESSVVAEARVSYHIRSVVSAANGVALAIREGDVAFRTFASPPYATLAGSLDSTLDLHADGTSDDGGSAATNANTLVTVEFRPAGAPSTTPLPANVWSVRDEHPANASPAWQP